MATAPLPYRSLGTRWVEVIEALPGQCRPWFMGRARLLRGYHARAGQSFPGTWFVIMVLRGQGMLQLGKRRQPTTAPCAIVLDGGDATQNWRYTGDGSGEPESIAVFLDGAWAVAAAAAVQRRSGGVVPLSADLPMLRQLGVLTSDLRQAPVELTGAEAQGLCANIIGALVAPAQRSQRNAATVLRRELERSDAHAASVAAIAARLGLSREHLTRTFTQAYGVPPAAWRTQHRLRKACQLLVAGNLPVKAVATACGYAQYSSFIRAFRAAVGVSPDRYRHAPFAW